MKFLKHTISVLFLFNMFIFSALADGYKIKVKIKGAKDTVQLGYYYADKQYVLKNETIDANGEVIFEGEKALKGGIYMIIVPHYTFFDLLIGDEQHFTIKTDTTDVMGKMQVTGSPMNAEFFAYQKFMVAHNKQIKELKEKIGKAPAASKAKLQTQLDAVKKETETHWKVVADKNKGTFLAKLLRATNSQETYNQNGGSYFFENIDFSEQRFLRSPIVFNTIQNVLAKNLNNNKSAAWVIRELDRLIEKSKANTDIYQYTISYLLNFFNTFHRVNMNQVFVHLSENYFLNGKADWLTEDNIKGLQKRTDVLSASFPGKVAKNLKMETLAKDSMSFHDGTAKNTILIFWKIGCDHCKESVLDLKAFKKEMKDKSLEIIAICTSKNRKDWANFVKKHQLTDFKHCWDPKNKTGYSDLFNIKSTPILYLLDANKKIVSKRVGPPQIDALLDQLRRQKDKL